MYLTSPVLNRSSVIQCFERGDTIEMCNGMTFDFYTRLSHLVSSIDAQPNVSTSSSEHPLGFEIVSRRGYSRPCLTCTCVVLDIEKVCLVRV